MAFPLASRRATHKTFLESFSAVEILLQTFSETKMTSSQEQNPRWASRIWASAVGLDAVSMMMKMTFLVTDSEEASEASVVAACFNKCRWAVAVVDFLHSLQARSQAGQARNRYRHRPILRMARKSPKQLRRPWMRKDAK